MQSNDGKNSVQKHGKGNTGKSNRQKNMARNNGGRNNSKSSDFKTSQNINVTWPRPMVNYPCTRVPVPVSVPVQLVPQPQINMAPATSHVFGTGVPMYSRYSISVPPPPISSPALPVQQNIPIIPNMAAAFPPLPPPAPRYTMNFSEFNTLPRYSKPRFAPVTITRALLTTPTGKAHWERETPHAIAIVDPDSKKDIRKEHIDNIRKHASLVDLSVEDNSLKSDTQGLSEGRYCMEDLQFLQESLISNEEEVTKNDLQEIVHDSCVRENQEDDQNTSHQKPPIDDKLEGKH